MRCSTSAAGASYKSPYQASVWVPGAWNSRRCLFLHWTWTPGHWKSISSNAHTSGRTYPPRSPPSSLLVPDHVGGEDGGEFTFHGRKLRSAGQGRDEKHPYDMSDPTATQQLRPAEARGRRGLLPGLTTRAANEQTSAALNLLPNQSGRQGPDASLTRAILPRSVPSHRRHLSCKSRGETLRNARSIVWMAKEATEQVDSRGDNSISTIGCGAALWIARFGFEIH